MPTIAMFYGIVINMHWRDHAPPHVHAFYQGHEALVAIETGEVIAGGLPRSATRLVREWVLLRQVELDRNWDRGRRRKAFHRVPGLDSEA